MAEDEDKGMTEQRTAVLPFSVLSEQDLERRFDMHFAAKYIPTDRLGTTVGAFVYLGLLPPLAKLGRADLMAAAACCALLCLWPHYFSRAAPAFYQRNRDRLIVAHFCFHYICGSQLARHVRLYNKLMPATPAAFLASFVLSSTLVWQALDALLYRMRFRRFILIKPLVLLGNLPLELSLCRQTCQDLPAFAHHFHTGAHVLRLLMAPLQALPTPLVPVSSPNDAVGACFKVQAFLLLALAWLVPSYLLYRSERQMLHRFRRQCGELVVSNAEAEALAPRPETSTATDAARASAVNRGRLRQRQRLVQDLQQRWQQHQAQEQAWQQSLVQAEPEECWEALPEPRVVRWLRICVLASLAWHAVDAVL